MEIARDAIKSRFGLLAYPSCPDGVILVLSWGHDTLTFDECRRELYHSLVHLGGFVVFSIVAMLPCLQMNE